MQKQEIDHIDKNINRVFHFLELKGVHSQLIGSRSMKGILYANDYDLNQNLKISDSVSVINGLYKQFLNIFNKAYRDEHYYITDFKNGVYEDEPIRWTYNDMKKGSKVIDGHTITFGECLLHDDNVIKLDLCYVHNNLFTDINMLYNFIISGDKGHDNDDIVEDFDAEIKKAQDEGNYFKVCFKKKI